MINIMNKVYVDNIPLECYRVYWVNGGSSVCVISQDSTGRRYIHCTNWTANTNGPMARLDKFEKEIIRMESLE